MHQQKFEYNSGGYKGHISLYLHWQNVRDIRPHSKRMDLVFIITKQSSEGETLIHH